MENIEAAERNSENVRICLLSVLSAAPQKRWSVAEIAGGMRKQRTKKGTKFSGQTYYNPLAKLEKDGLVARPRKGERQITQSGLDALLVWKKRA